MNTNYFLNLVAGNVFGTDTSPGIPSTYYIGLSTSNPATSVSEPATTRGYARVSLSGKLSEPTNGVITNSNAIEFPEVTSSSWGTIGYYVIYDNGTRGSGNLLIYGPLNTSRTAEVGTVLTIATGNLSISVANPS